MPSTTKGTNVALLDASPRLTMEIGTVNGKVRTFQDTVAVAALDFDADGDAVHLAEVPSGAKIVSIKIANDGLETATTGTVNVGLYNGPSAFTSSTPTSYAADGLIDEDCYATLSTDFQLNGAAFTEYAFEARNINAVNNYVWEDAGLPENPGVPLRIAITQTGAPTGALGDASIIVEYVID
jgi:hypothetical protein